MLDSAMGQMRVKAAFAAIHAIEGHHPLSADEPRQCERHLYLFDPERQTAHLPLYSKSTPYGYSACKISM